MHFNLRIPPLYAKTGSNQRFQFMGNTFILVQCGSFIFFPVLDLHLKSDLNQGLSMIHACDVINFNINESDQKPFAYDHFQLVQKASILIVVLGSICQIIKVLDIRFHRTLSEGQEIDRMLIVRTKSRLNSYYGGTQL